MKINTYKLEEEERYVDFRSYIGGVYFGDPCYVVPGWDDDVDLWDQLCDKMFEPVIHFEKNGEKTTSREESFDGKNNIRVVDIHRKMDEPPGRFYMWNTAYGDGGYPITFNDQKVADVGVDAGCLSIVPMNLINKWGKESAAKDLGYVYEGPGLHGFLAVEEGDMRWNRWDILTGYNSQEDDGWDDGWAGYDKENN
jgi:hypothetical protein